MKLIIEPRDGVTPLLAAIKGAKRSIEIAIFRFDRTDVETALTVAAARGVKVTVLIAFTNRGGEQRLRKLELRCLAAGMTVVRTADDLQRYHGKYIIIDRRILYVLSFNFTHLDIERSRSFGIVTAHAKWVHEATRLFRADCTRTTYKPKMETFVVSPANARPTLAKFLKRAKRQLLIYDLEISDKEMLQILEARAKAGVEIKVIGVVRGPRHFDVQKKFGMRLHTRVIIRDRREAFIGSQSLRPRELDSRREVGLIIHDAKAVSQIVQTFESDWTTKAKTGRESKKPGDSKGKPAKGSQKQAAQDVRRLQKSMDPVVVSVKKAVRKAVAKSGEDMLNDKDVKRTMKRVVKKAVKKAVKEAVLSARDAHVANEDKRGEKAKDEE